MSQFDYLILGRVRKEETAARSIRTHPGMAPSGNASLSGPNTAGHSLPLLSTGTLVIHERDFDGD
jgi:hypothetical protein